MTSKVIERFVLGLFFPLLLLSCSKRSDSTIVLTTDSAMGSTVHVASFDGNSAFKNDDCDLVSSLLSEKYSRTYSCSKWEHVKEEIED